MPRIFFIFSLLPPSSYRFWRRSLGPLPADWPARPPDFTHASWGAPGPPIGDGHRPNSRQKCKQRFLLFNVVRDKGWELFLASKNEGSGLEKMKFEGLSWLCVGVCGKFNMKECCLENILSLIFKQKKLGDVFKFSPY